MNIQINKEIMTHTQKKEGEGVTGEKTHFKHHHMKCCASTEKQIVHRHEQAIETGSGI